MNAWAGVRRVRREPQPVSAPISIAWLVDVQHLGLEEQHPVKHKQRSPEITRTHTPVTLWFYYSFHF